MKEDTEEAIADGIKGVDETCNRLLEEHEKEAKKPRVIEELDLKYISLNRDGSFGIGGTILKER